MTGQSGWRRTIFLCIKNFQLTIKPQSRVLGNSGFWELVRGTQCAEARESAVVAVLRNVPVTASLCCEGRPDVISALLSGHLVFLKFSAFPILHRSNVAT